MMEQWKGWKSFRFAGRQFLALDSGRGWHVFGPGFENFGAWQRIENFKKNYKLESKGIEQ